MKKYVLVTLTSIVFIISIVACNKGAQVVNTNTYNTSPTALLPLKPGNVWYYQDSTFDSTTHAFESVLVDSALVVNSTVTALGNPYWVVEENDSTGCFGNWGYYTNYPPTNGLFQIVGLSVSSTSYSQYLLWGQAASDSSQLTQTYTGITSLSCAYIQNTYGFTHNYTINGYNNCYRNLIQFQNCQGTTNYVIYVSAGIGVVRYEVWQTPNAASNTFYLQYSQTLTGYKLK